MYDILFFYSCLSSSYFLVYQKNADNTPQQYIDRLNDVIKKYTTKDIIPVIDPGTMDLVSLKIKLNIIVELGFKNVAILYRNPSTYLEQWQVIQSILCEAKIDFFSLGIYRRWDKDKATQTNYSTLCKPLIFGSKGVAHYRPWSGGASEDMMLCSNLDYLPIRKAGIGMANYNGENRLQRYEKIKKTYRYNFCRVDAVLEAQEILSKIGTLSNVQKLIEVSSNINGFRFFKQKFGLD